MMNWWARRSIGFRELDAVWSSMGFAEADGAILRESGTARKEGV
jgi:hypothetical protein